ncbi:hypothetical protein HDZ31DRAFT_77841 [Schizophyllum fasciatum]
MENHGYWVGPMPMGDFLDNFIPATGTESLDARCRTLNVRNEKEIYDILITGTGDGKNNAASAPDSPSATRCVDLGDGRLYFDEALEDVKDRLYADIFVDDAEPGSFVSHLDKDADSAGRALTYIERMHSHLHREFSFFLFIDAEHFRVIRADRDGFIVTEQTKWADPTTHVTNNRLNDFLDRFDNMSDKQQGFDTTVNDAPEPGANITRARKALERVIPEDMKPKGEKPELPIRKIGVPCAGAEHGLRWFYVSDPTSSARGMRSRATRGYPAWDPVTATVIFIKDYWRSDTGDMLKEAEVIRELNGKGVKHAPTLICGDDLSGQRTITGDYVDAKWNKGQRKAHHARVHHRIAMNFCLPLWKFRSTRHLLQILYNAFTCHRQAVERCRKLHRDFSAWNILWDESSEEGVLSDWDFCAPMPLPGADESDPTINMMAQMPSRSGRPDRTGTWMFMSTLSLTGKPKLHDVQDDLEALFWVGVYMIVLYTPYPETEAIYIVDEVLTEYKFRDGAPIGGAEKTALITGSRDFHLPDHPVLAGWILTYSDLLDEWLTYKKNVARQQQSQEDILGLCIPSRNNHIQPPDLRDHTVLDAEWSSLIEQGDKLGLFKDNGRCNDKDHDKHPFDVLSSYRERDNRRRRQASEARAWPLYSPAISQRVNARSTLRSQSPPSSQRPCAIVGPSLDPASDDGDDDGEEAKRAAKRLRTSINTFKRASPRHHDTPGEGSLGRGKVMAQE